MSEVSDNNKALTVKFFEQVFNNGNYDLVAALISPDYQFNGVPSTPDAIVNWAKGLRAHYPDLYFTIETILGEDEKVALRWRMTATDPDTGQKGYFLGTNILVFVSGMALSNDQGGGDEFKPMA